MLVLADRRLIVVLAAIVLAVVIVSGLRSDPVPGPESPPVPTAGP